jgi:hypothetical protein
MKRPGGQVQSLHRRSARRSSLTLTPLLTSTVFTALAQAGSASSKIDPSTICTPSTILLQTNSARSSGRAPTSRPRLLYSVIDVHLLTFRGLLDPQDMLTRKVSCRHGYAVPIFSGK